MFVVPQRINIKRRRQEEPVEFLYFEDGNHRNKRRFTDFYFQREGSRGSDATATARNAHASQQSPQRASSSNGPRIPIVRATSSGEELRARTRENSVIANPNGQTRKSQGTVDAHKCSVTDYKDASNVELTQPRSEKPINPRRFELAQISPKASDYSQVSKARSTFNSDGRLTIFIESPATEKPKRTNDTSIVSSKKEDVDISVPSIRRRPGPSFSRNVHQSSLTSPSHRNQATRSKNLAATTLEDHRREASPEQNNEPDELVQQLENIALECMGEDEHGQMRHDACSPGALGNGSIVQHDANVDDDYVFETYLRKPVHDEVCLLGEDGARDTRHVGYLVIHEDEEGLWDIYVEDEEGGDWDEEDYDSNAEDNPANDYPEEVDSDEQPWSDASEDGEYDLHENND
ncbi:MAG: hypothetical protein Q9160_007764 [Pyrenula sp. 1 TL-2023]